MRSEITTAGLPCGLHPLDGRNFNCNPNSLAFHGMKWRRSAIPWPIVPFWLRGEPWPLNPDAERLTREAEEAGMTADESMRRRRQAILDEGRKRNPNFRLAHGVEGFKPRKEAINGNRPSA